eukprot:16315_1
MNNKNVIIDTLKSKIDQFQNEIHTKNATINQMKTQVKFQDELVVNLRNEINSVKQQNQELKQQLNEQFKFMLSAMNQTETKNNDDDNKQKSAEDFAFDIPKETAKNFTKINKHQLLYKGSMTTLGLRWCKFGPVLSKNDFVTVFITVSKHDPEDYSFGFASPKTQNWNRGICHGCPSHAAAVNMGVKNVYLRDEFKSLNDKQAIEKQKSSIRYCYTIALSVNMKQKLGWIWYGKDTYGHGKIEFNLPEQVYFIVGVGGSVDNKLVVTKVIVK